MKRPKRLLPRSEDFAFIREAVNDVREVRQLRKFADNHVKELRTKIAKRVVNALWRRYKAYHKGIEEPPTFIEWLLECQYLHMTYRHHSFDVRLYWVYRVIITTRVPELRLLEEDDAPGTWYYTLITQLVVAKVPPLDGEFFAVPATNESEEFAEEVPTVEFQLLQVA